MRKIKLYLISNFLILLVITNLFGAVLANKYRNINNIISPLITFKVNKYGNREGVILNPSIIFSKKLNLNLQKTFQKIYFYSSVGLIFLIFYKKKELTTHGSSRFAKIEEIKDFGLLGVNDGVVLGMTPNNKIMTQNGSEHIMAMAPTRSGKGINTVLPTLYTWKHSVIVNDIKGECWDLTSGFRRSVLGQKCVYFNPVDDSGEGISYNPLSLVGIGQSREIEDIKTIATTLLDINDKADDSHWITGAIKLFVAVAIHVMYVNPSATFMDIIAFMEDPNEPLIDKIKSILGKDFDEDGNIISVGEPFNHYLVLKKTGIKNRDFIDLYGNSRYDGIHPTVGSTFITILGTPDKERGSIISSCVSRLEIFKDPRIRKNIMRSDITPREIMDNKVALYLITPPKAIKMTRPLFRLIITQCIYELTDKMEFNNRKKIDKEVDSSLEKIKKKIYNLKFDLMVSMKKIKTNKNKKNKRILFLIDEFPALGNLALLETALAFIAGYGLKVLMITQSINQLRKIYGKDNSIIDNCHTQLYFTPNDDETPQMISKMLGKQTLKITTKSGKGITLENRNEGYSSRDLMTPDEIRKLSFEEILLFVSGKIPIKGKKIFWYKHKLFKNNANYNIPYRSYLIVCDEIEKYCKRLKLKYFDEYILEYLIYIKDSYKDLKKIIDEVGVREFVEKILFIKELDEELKDLKKSSSEDIEKLKRDIIDELFLEENYKSKEEFEKIKKEYLKDFTDEDLEIFILKKYYKKLTKEDLEDLLELNLAEVEKMLEKTKEFRNSFKSKLFEQGVTKDLITPIPEEFIYELQKIIKQNNKIEKELFKFISVSILNKPKEQKDLYTYILESIKDKYKLRKEEKKEEIKIKPIRKIKVIKRNNLIKKATKIEELEDF